MTFKIGPNQERWLSFLERNPHLQGRGKLGFLDKLEELDKPQSIQDFRLCCLGAGVYTLTEENFDRFLEKHYNWESNRVIGNDRATARFYYLSSEQGALLGLFNEEGSFCPGTGKIKLVRGKPEVGSLSEANDVGYTWLEIAVGYTWLEIAKFIRENPEKVFCKSV